MAKKNRTIFYYSPEWRDKDNQPIDIPSTFWNDIWDEINALDGSSFSFKHYGRDYIVQAKSIKSPSVKFLYIGKVRSKDDWPDHRDQDSDQIERLAQTGIGGHLIEGAYLTASGHENVVAISRTQNGATISAISAAISHHFNTLQSGNRFELTPFARSDQLRRLQEADGATRLQLTLDNDADLAELDGDDKVSKALAKAKEIDTGNQMTVGITLSFGNHTVSPSIQDDIKTALINLFGKETDIQKFKKAEATLTNRDKDGKLRKDSIDFISDRITIKESFQNDENEQPEPEHILQGMLEANSKFREKLRKI